MIAYHGKQEVKEKYLARVRQHAAADQIVRGMYWENGKGCAVGCTIHGSDHARYEEELGIPRAIARLEDKLFEGMANEAAMRFPVAFLESVNVGSDLSLVLPKFYVRIFSDPERGTILRSRNDGKVAIQKITDLFGELIKGNEVTRETWIEARDASAASASASYTSYAAYAAADDAAYAYTVAAYAADAYAYTVADAAADAYAYASRQDHYDWMGNVLLEIIRETGREGR